MKFQTTDFFTPTRDLNADDVVFSFERQLQRGQSVEQVRRQAPPTNTSAGTGFPDLAQVDRKG